MKSKAERIAEVLKECGDCPNCNGTGEAPWEADPRDMREALLNWLGGLST